MRNTTDRELLPSNTFTPHHHQFFSLLITAWGLSWPSSLAWSWEIIEILRPDGSVFQEARIVWYFSEGGICLQGQYIFLNRSICCFVDVTILCQFVYWKILFTSETLSFSWICQSKRMETREGKGKMADGNRRKKEKKNCYDLHQFLHVVLAHR